MHFIDNIKPKTRFNPYQNTQLQLEGLDCSDCVLVVEHSLERMEGVLKVGVDYTEQLLQVQYDRRLTSQWAIRRRLHHLGYQVAADGLEAWYKDNRELVFSLLGGVLLLVTWLGITLGFITQPAGNLLYILVFILAGFDPARHALHALRKGHLDTDFLMVLAALGAAAIGEVAEGGLLLFLFSLGHALEERILDRARQSVRSLSDLTPHQAIVRRLGQDIRIAVEQLAIGDVVVIQPGVRFPVDGRVITGVSTVDQSPITGESQPCDKKPGDQVYAGSVNGEGALEVGVTCLARDSTLARVMKLVEQAETQASPTQQFTEKVMRIFVPVVLFAVTMVVIIPPFFGVPFQQSLLQAMTLLVATSPCALALGTPAAILAGIGRAAHGGVLTKGGAHLENLGRLKAVAFDKTGTLTWGRPQVTDVMPCPGYSETDLLYVAGGLESRSAHPLARAVVEKARVQGVELKPAQKVEGIHGRGVLGEIDGRTASIGNLAWLREQCLSVPVDIEAQVQALEKQGKTVVLIVRDGTCLGWLALRDEIRPGAAQAIQALRRLGVEKQIMLSGDNPQAATGIAAQLGLDEVMAGLSPEGKFQAITNLTRQYGTVAMVGDGINDAPALAYATVGIAIGGASTDVALEAADVALMAPNLEKLPFAIGLGRFTYKIIFQNLIIAFGVMIVLSILAVSGLTGIGPAILFHEGSTIAVALNALRLLRYDIAVGSIP